MRHLRTLPALITLLAVGTGCAFIERVDVDTPNPGATPVAVEVAVNSDGRYVAFGMTQLGLGRRVFVRDLVTGTTEPASINPLGAVPFNAMEPAISANGRWVAYTAFRTDIANGRHDVFLFDRDTDVTVRVTDQVSDATPNSWSPAVSVDGDKVAFVSSGANLVAGDTNGVDDVFVWTRSTDATVRASLLENGAQSTSAARDPFINDSGRYVTYADSTQNIALRDVLLSTTDIINPEFGPGAPTTTARPSVSENGRYVAFDGTIAAESRAYRFDRTADVLVTVSLTAGGLPATNSWVGQISGDGLMVSFTSTAAATPQDTNPGTDLFVRDIAAGRTKLLSSSLLLGTWNGAVTNPSTAPNVLSRDGNYAAFLAEGTGLVDGQGSGVYVRATRHVTVTSAIPSNLPDGNTTVIELVGTGFRSDTQVSLSGPARERWNVTLVHYLDENTMHVTVQVVAGAAPGPVSIVAINPGSAWGPYKGAANWCLDCVQIT